VFSVAADGTQFRTLHSFSAIHSSNGTNADGAFPVGGLVLVGNTVYGTAFSGGPGSAGAVFGLPISAPPAVITNVIRNADGTVTLFFQGSPDSTNIVQATTNIAPSLWENASTNVADAGGAWQFTEGTATNDTRFYRSYAP
jgi:hypothetical protein